MQQQMSQQSDSQSKKMCNKPNSTERTKHETAQKHARATAKTNGGNDENNKVRETKEKETRVKGRSLHKWQQNRK